MTYGARPLRRSIARLLVDNLADKILEERLKEGQTVMVDIENDNKVRFNIS